jgi:hypothetical protein
VNLLQKLSKKSLCVKDTLKTKLENELDMGLGFKLILVVSFFLREPPILVLSH